MKQWQFRLVLTLVWLSTASLLHAIYSPPFDLDRSAGTAHTIVVGIMKPDSTLEVTDVLKGIVHVGDRLKLDRSGYNFEHLAKSMGESGDVEMVGFLSEPLDNGAYRLSSHFVGISLSGKVFTWIESRFSMTGSSFEAHPSWTKASFTSEVRHSLHTKAKLDAILALPRSRQRMREVIGFLRANISPEPERALSMWHRRGFLFGHAMTQISEPSAEEEQTLEESLLSSADAHEQVLILDILAGAPASIGVFEAARSFTKAGINPLVRRSAFDAIAAVEPYRAADVLSSYLVFDEPDLDAVMTALGACGNMREPKKMNPRVVEPLRVLAKQTFGKMSGQQKQRGWKSRLQDSVLLTAISPFVSSGYGGMGGKLSEHFGTG